MPLKLCGSCNHSRMACFGVRPDSNFSTRTLAYLAMTAIKLLEVGELEQRLAALEAAIHGQKSLPESAFDVEPAGSEFSFEFDA